MDYKEILKGIVDIINTTEKSDIGFANICTYIGENCPELKESEDERVRKEIINYFKCQSEEEPTRKEIHNKWIAWLENIPYTIDHEKREGFHLGYKACLERQTEQKPEGNKGNIGGISANWSDDDERMLDYVIGDILSADTLIGGKETASYKCDWLKSLKGRVQHQQEWSKEDEACVILLDSICESSEAEYYDHPDSIIRKEIVNARNWLKYLKGRVKPQWKPSVEQMDTLWFYAEQNNYDGAVLTLLYNDLKKLKEE